MTEFVFALDVGATSQQEAIVNDGLIARFPGHQFTAAAADCDFANAIIPIVGKPHPNEKDELIVTLPPARLWGDVHDAFVELSASARNAKLS